MKCHLDLCQNRYETRMDSTSFCIRLHFDHEYMAVYFVNAWIFLIRTEVVMVSFSTSLQESKIRTRRQTPCTSHTSLPPFAPRPGDAAPERCGGCTGTGGTASPRSDDRMNSQTLVRNALERSRQAPSRLAVPAMETHAAFQSGGPGESGGLQ